MKQFSFTVEKLHQVKKIDKEEINNIDCGTKETKQDLILIGNFTAP